MKSSLEGVQIPCNKIQSSRSHTYPRQEQLQLTSNNYQQWYCSNTIENETKALLHEYLTPPRKVCTIFRQAL